ncbi:hypothetical protein [Arthrobacter sp. Soil762]|uniref:hypothetical protein n=1 Tax=Arthrobacter sp. Soil762 TaxID=1736401 RepID=UPI0006F988F9|nr:hypothetical protein [Arthrobacter sp. Soil762]KRE72694.1 hypothetical protein ASG77_08500 [Arthrobacter sp. Soil762]
MTTITTNTAPDGATTLPTHRPWCSGCRSPEHLMLESISPVRPPATDIVDVAYTCVECDSFYAHPVSVVDAARILDRRAAADSVLQFGGDYMHCGQTMTTTGTTQRRLHTPLRTDGPAEDLLEVYLRTQVLHCLCGFQMEIPT